MLRLPNDQTSTKSTHSRGTFVAFVREPRRARNAESAARQPRNRRLGRGALQQLAPQTGADAIVEMHANARQCPQVDTFHGKIKEPAAGRPSRHRVAPGSKHAKGNNSEKRWPLRGSHCGTFGRQILVLRKQLRLNNARCRRSVAERAAKTPAAEPDGFSKKSHRPQWMARARGGVPAAPQRREMLRLPNDQTSTKSTHFRGTFVAFVREPRRARNAESAARQPRNRRFGLFCPIMICRCALWVRTSATFPVGHRVYGRGTH